MVPNKLIQCVCFVYVFGSCWVVSSALPWSFEGYPASGMSYRHSYDREPDSSLRWFAFVRNPWMSAAHDDSPYIRHEVSTKRNADYPVWRPQPERSKMSYRASVDAMRELPQPRGIDNRPETTRINWNPRPSGKESHNNPKDSVIFEEFPSLRTTASSQNYVAPNVTSDTNTTVHWKPVLQGNGKPCSDEDKFCENISTYPETEIKMQLGPKLDELSQFFGADILPEPNEAPKLRVGPMALTNVDEMELCESESTIRFPKMAKTKDEKWMYIVNVENYTQGVKVEKCKNEGSSCQFADYFPAGSTTHCRQKYTYRKLVAVNEDGKTVTEVFPMPSCCVCQVKLSPLLRIRQPLVPQTSTLPPVREPADNSDGKIIFSDDVHSGNDTRID